ncbi:relaxase/mobilization nuclease domain-containing protein [Methylomarinovum tepidoasis]|uniref:relaxase/mobilization nuclease domain-containing protein n=1 Tax=Methylomarinovum tepidoasis TaxID=2840183 RepID=UPI00257333FD|nr:hypothetical protein [Methylomarinovum sp. IN45]
MHIKFIPRGTGSAKAAADYLLQGRDHSGEKRAGVEVLRGDPQLVADVADSLDFVHRYTSGVIAWAPEDAPSDGQIDEVLRAFEQVAFAGLDPDRYAWTAVLHREHGGGCHVHLLVARVDLETGKSLNIAPPGWRHTYDPLRDYFNAKYGWARPDDPARSRPVQPADHRAYLDAAAIRRALKSGGDDIEDLSERELLTRFLVQRIEAGAIRNRSDVVAAIRSELGLEVSRMGKNYLTVIIDPDAPAAKGRLRLKGGIYEESFDTDQFLETRRQAQGQGSRGPGPHRRPDPAAAKRYRKRLEAIVQRRAAFHRGKYGGSEPENPPGADAALDAGADRGPEPLYRYLSRSLGPDAIPGKPDRAAAHRKRRARGGGPGPGAAKPRVEDGQRTGWSTVPDPATGFREWFAMWWQRMRALAAIQQMMETPNDGIGNRIIESLKQAIEGIHRTVATAESTNRSLEQANRRIGTLIGAAGALVEQVESRLNRSSRQVYSRRPENDEGPGFGLK